MRLTLGSRHQPLDRGRHIFQFRGPGKQDVIFQIDMLVQVNFQCFQRAVQGPETNASIRRNSVVGTGLAHSSQNVSGC